SRLPQALTPKVDLEDVVQSVFRSFYQRHAAARFSFDTWDELWSLLAYLTVQKCGHSVRHFRAARRDFPPEVPLPVDSGPSGSDWPPVDPEPSVEEAVLLAESLEELLNSLKPDQRLIVQLRLEGDTIEQVSGKVRCTERTVYRVLRSVRARLETAF